MAKRYTINDGKLVLTLEPMEEGGYIVRSPMDPEILTSADSIPEAFENAHDAWKLLQASRRDAARKVKGKRKEAG